MRDQMDSQLGLINHTSAWFAEQDVRFNDEDKDNEMSRSYIGSPIIPMENHQEQNTWTLSGARIVIKLAGNVRKSAGSVKYIAQSVMGRVGNVIAFYMDLAAYNHLVHIFQSLTTEFLDTSSIPETMDHERKLVELAKIIARSGAFNSLSVYFPLFAINPKDRAEIAKIVVSNFKLTFFDIRCYKIENGDDFANSSKPSRHFTVARCPTGIHPTSRQ